MDQSAQPVSKQDQILRAATRVIKDKGLQGLSFEAVSVEAGFSRQLVRYYYSDIESLIVALCDYLGNGYRDILISGIVEVSQVQRLGFFQSSYRTVGCGLFLYLVFK